MTFLYQSSKQRPKILNIYTCNGVLSCQYKVFLIELLVLKHNASDSLFNSIMAQLTRRLHTEERDRHVEDDHLTQ